MATASGTLTTVRGYAATTVRVVTIAFALALVIGAAFVALGDVINRDNGIVSFVLDVAGAVDGPFSREDGVFSFDGEGLTAVTNWGLAAVVWFVVGRIVTGLLER